MIEKESLKNIETIREVLIQDKSFAYILPCKSLRAFISNFTITFPDTTTISNDYTIMPHACVTLVMFIYKSKFYSFLFGPTTLPRKVGDIANQCDVIVIVEFQPAGFFVFSNSNQKELMNRIIPFSMVDYTLNNALHQVFIHSTSIEELLIHFEEVFQSSIQFKYPVEFTDTIKSIIQNKGIINIDEASHHVFYSPRHLNRLFNQYLGMSMKSFSRMVKINYALHLLNEDMSLEDIAISLNYFDVSHFVKDFKKVCLTTPKDYRMHMSDFYSEIAKY